jgi:hypothetical protein
MSINVKKMSFSPQGLTVIVSVWGSRLPAQSDDAEPKIDVMRV